MAQFNSQQFAWADVTVQIGDRVLTGIQAVSYKSSQEKEFVYGKGNEPLNIQRGNKAYEGSVKLLQGELELLFDGAPNKDLLDYRNLNITIAYEKDQQVITDTLIGVEFTEVDKAMEQNGKQMEVELPIMFLRVKYNS